MTELPWFQHVSLSVNVLNCTVQVFNFLEHCMPPAIFNIIEHAQNQDLIYCLVWDNVILDFFELL